MKRQFYILGIVMTSIFLLYGCRNDTNVIVDNTIYVNNASEVALQGEPIAAPQNIDIFIDASGSMKGYFKADSNNTIINTVSSFHGLLPSSNSKLYFNGYKKAYTGLVSKVLKNTKSHPSNKATSFHKDMAMMGENNMDGGKLSFLVTDGIMSEWKVDMIYSLKQLENIIRDSLSRFSSTQAVAVYQYVSFFDGEYYDKDNHGKSIKCNRPYYVIAMGPKSLIRWLRTKESEFNPVKSIYFGIHDIAAHNEYVMDDDSTYRLEKRGEPIILDATLPKCFKGYTVDFIKDNLKVVMNGEEDITGKCKIEMYDSESYQITIDQTKCSVFPMEGGYVSFDVKVMNVIPEEWLALNCNNDVNINDPARVDLQFKTFGLTSVLKGIKKGIESDSEELLNINYKFKL